MLAGEAELVGERELAGELSPLALDVGVIVAMGSGSGSGLAAGGGGTTGAWGIGGWKLCDEDVGAEAAAAAGGGRAGRLITATYD